MLEARAWILQRIREARSQAAEAREAAREMEDPAVAAVARQLAADLDAVADKYEARLAELEGRAIGGQPPV